MGSAGFIAGCLIGVSIIYTVIMGFVASRTIPTERLDLENEKGVKR